MSSRQPPLRPRSRILATARAMQSEAKPRARSSATKVDTMRSDAAKNSARDGTRIDETRGDVFAPLCPARGVLDNLTSRWGVLAMVALLEGMHRFGELHRKVPGVSEKMLTQTLRALERDGLVLREVFPEVPPRVHYSLTPMGEEAALRLESLTDWIEDNMNRVIDSRTRRS